jgi:hypothetical protein
LDAATGGGGAIEDDVLHLLDVDAGTANLLSVSPTRPGCAIQRRGHGG